MRAFLAVLCLAFVASVAYSEDKKPVEPKPIDPVKPIVTGPIVGPAVKGVPSKPLSELAADAEKAKAEAEKQLDEPTKAIRKVLKEKHGAAGENGAVAALTDADVAKAFPKTAFYSLKFRQWPVAYLVPDGLSAGNVCVVDGDNVTIIPNAKTLEQFFVKQLPAAAKDEDKVAAAKAWLRLSQEMHNDGFYKFKPLDEKAIKVEKDAVTGTSSIEPAGGNQGQIDVTLKFDAGGKVAKAEEKAAFKTGVRPICQATKLLDADPLVRRIAQRDILVMGRVSLPYLLEQRAKATPELQEAIDQAWEQILEEGR